MTRQEDLRTLEDQHDEAASAWGRGLHEFQMGRMSAMELKVLKVRLGKLGNALTVARYEEFKSRCEELRL